MRLDPAEVTPLRDHPSTVPVEIRRRAHARRYDAQRAAGAARADIVHALTSGGTSATEAAALVDTLITSLRAADALRLEYAGDSHYEETESGYSAQVWRGLDGMNDAVDFLYHSRRAYPFADDGADAPTTYTYTTQTYARDGDGYVEREFAVKGPLYHGGGKGWRQGTPLRPGRRTNGWGDEGERSRYVHFTTRLDVAAEYAERTGGHVFEVEPMGDFRPGYNGGEYKTEQPLNVLRKLDREEWQ